MMGLALTNIFKRLFTIIKPLDESRANVKTVEIYLINRFVQPEKIK